MGQLFVDSATLPAGPFLAYDHDGKLISTIYMLPIKDLNPDKRFEISLRPVAMLITSTSTTMPAIRAWGSRISTSCFGMLQLPRKRGSPNDPHAS